MNFSALVFSCTVVIAVMPSLGWIGIKSKARPAPARPAVVAASPAKPAADTTSLSLKVRTISAESHGVFLGNLEGVRCLNCTPNVVQLNLGSDSVSGATGVLSMRIEAWNAIERPLKDRRMYDYDNRCFYFGFKETDTAFVAGEWTEIRVQSIPCYPYLKRTLQASVAAAPEAMQEAATAGTPAPAEAKPENIPEPSLPLPVEAD